MGTDDDDIVLAWLRNRSFEQTEDYVRRGRHLADVSTEELKRQWVEAFRIWAANYGTEDHRVREDLEAELQLRRDEPPFDLVADEINVLKAHSRLAPKR